MKGSRGCGRVSEFLSPHGTGAGQQPLSLIQVQRLQNLQPFPPCSCRGLELSLMSDGKPLLSLYGRKLEQKEG